MRVLVLAEYYPRAADPVLGIWAHQQALATQAAGAELSVVVLHRPLPSLRAVLHGDAQAAWANIRQPAHADVDGLGVRYLRYLSPPRPWSYGTWGAWAAPVLRRALPAIRERFGFELIHAHYAVPAGDAARRVAPDLPLVVSVHGGDLFGAHASSPGVVRTLRHARLVLANSTGTARRCAELGAQEVRVVHLGSDPAPAATAAPASLTLVTVGNLVARKRHADVIRAVAILHARHPGLRYVIVGDGPEREPLRALALELGVGDRVELPGALPHGDAVARARAATVFVMPSVDEAFGVSYVEAMAAGVPAVGSRGEDGPEEILAAGGGIELVEPRDPQGLARCLDGLLADPARREALGRAARATVERSFTWSGCGLETLSAYRDALRSGAPHPRPPRDRNDPPSARRTRDG